MEQGESRYEVSPAPDNREEIPDQQVAGVSQLLGGADQESISTAPSPEPGEIEPLEQHSQENPQEPQIKGHVEVGASEPKTALIHHENTDQLHNFKEPVEAQTQQESTHSNVQPKENAQAQNLSVPPTTQARLGSPPDFPPDRSRDDQRKRSRGRIQEQPAGDRDAQPTPPPPSRSHMKNQEVPKGADAQAGEAGRKAISIDDLFSARGTDRSPQAWLARLMGTKSVARDEGASPEVKPALGREDAQIQAGDGEQPESKPQAAISGQSARNEAIAPISEGSNPLKLQAGRIRSQQDDRLPASRGTKVARKDVQIRAAATPLSQRTRRFLRPLVGIDPASVPVQRDIHAEHLVDAYQADAITIGDEVEVAAGHQDDTPETLGLLAHEFTHVARQREPRFIPPVVRSMHSAHSTSSLTSSVDEEVLALQVEGQVKWMAQQQVEQMVPFSDPAVSPLGPSAATSSGTDATSAGNTWGGLPAPWEPLPDWLLSSPVDVEGGAPIGVNSFQPQSPPGGTERASEAYGSGNRGTVSIAGTGDTGVQRAGTERSLNMEETQVATAQPPPDTAKTPEPDLDALARQVYAHLKRRLEVERRRGS